jgi:hypothetical protein
MKNDFILAILKRRKTILQLKHVAARFVKLGEAELVGGLRGPGMGARLS